MQGRAGSRDKAQSLLRRALAVDPSVRMPSLHPFSSAVVSLTLDMPNAILFWRILHDVRDFARELLQQKAACFSLISFRRRVLSEREGL
jgi:hypothetical protein